ncbi:MAG: DUF1540 domain-containing protein [Christensenellaceae bacterium]|jgi:hypothetical protein|nr:DUF1540 domain-containing protein [Christensenellaceae bacterium]
MNQLKCTTGNCQHNLLDRCTSSVITMSPKAICETRIKRAGGSLEQTFAELETVEERLQDAPAMVACESKCKFNCENRCTADTIIVGDTIFNVCCKTRIK